MTDAPERIWAVPEYNCTVYMSGNSPITAQNGPFTHHRHGAASEYIRADMVEAMETARDCMGNLWAGAEAENQRLRASLQECLEIVESVSDKRAYRALKTRARAALRGTEASHD